MGSSDKIDNYAEKIEIMLGCRQKVDALAAEYVEHIRSNGQISSNGNATRASIGRFLRDKKDFTVHLHGPKTSQYCGSTCLEISVAAALIAARVGIPSKVFYSASLFNPLHYSITDDRGADFEIAGVNCKIQKKFTFIRWELTPESVAKHMRLVDMTAKRIKWKAAERTVLKLTRKKNTLSVQAVSSPKSLATR